MKSSGTNEELRVSTILSGAPYDLGRRHGEQLASQIAAYLDEFLRHSAEVFETPFDAVLANVRRLESHIDLDYLEEMRGIADGAGLEYADILALNTFVDTDLILTSQQMTCINVVAFGEASADGSLVHGRNLDFPHRDALLRAATVFRCRPAKGHPFLSVAWAGHSGAFTAMNAAGITVTELSFVTDDVQAEATPMPFIVRRIAQYASSIDDAVEIVATSRRSAGFNLTVTDSKIPEARAIEFTATRYGVREADRGCLVVSDNRLSKEMRKGQLAEPCAVARYIRALELAEAHRGKVDVEVMKQILADRFDLLTRRESATYNCICSRNTIQSVVFAPQQRRAWVSNRTVPAPLGQYVRYSLSA